MQTIISELVKNFTSIAQTFNLSRPNTIKQLNGDLRALLLVNTAKPDHLTPTLLEALVILTNRVEKAEQLLKTGKIS